MIKNLNDILSFITLIGFSGYALKLLLGSLFDKHVDYRFIEDGISIIKLYREYRDNTEQ